MDKVLKSMISCMFACCTVLLLSLGVLADETQDLVDDSYFNDTVFVGDSISYKLKLYVESEREVTPDFFGNAQFLAVGGFGSVGAQQPVSGGSFHPRYQGQKMLLEDSVPATGAKTMYIMFGMNDLVPAGVDGALESMESLLDKILQSAPGLNVVVQSVTPIMTGKEQVILNNQNIRDYNDGLREMCSRRGFAFLDVGAQMTDDDGGLIPSYCGDAQGLAMHLSDEACRVWIDYLRENPFFAEDASSEVSAETSEQENTGESDQELSDEQKPEADDGLAQELELEDGFGQELEEFVQAPKPEETAAPETSTIKTDPLASAESWYAGLETEEFLKQYALDTTGASAYAKKWKPKLKGRALNPPA